MGTQVFLGTPPQHVIDWIREHSKPATEAETHIKFYDRTEGDYLIEGAMDYWALIAAGLMPEGSGTEFEPYWNNGPIEVEVGSAVTSIGEYAFYNCGSLTNVTIPSSVTRVGGYYVFMNCTSLTSIVVEGKTTAQARELLANAGLSDINIVTGSIPG